MCKLGPLSFKPCFHLKLDTGTYGNQLCKVPAESYLVFVVPWTKIVIGCCSWSFFNKLLRKILRHRCIGRDLRWKCIFSGSTLTIPEHWDTSSWQWTRNTEGRHLLLKSNSDGIIVSPTAWAGVASSVTKFSLLSPVFHQSLWEANFSLNFGLQTLPPEL